MRRVVLLAGGVLLAGAGLFMSSGAGPSATPNASMEGAVLEPEETDAEPVDSRAPADEIAKFAALADKTRQDASIQLDLDKLKLVGGHCEAPLRDGRRAVLTLDPELQALAEKLLDQSRAPRGAIVAMAPDGRILAFAGRRTEQAKGGKQGIFDFRLATEVWAPAASIFKLVTASALFRAGVDPDGKVCFHGGLRSVLEHNLRDDRRDLALRVADLRRGALAERHPRQARVPGKLGQQVQPDPAAAGHAVQRLGHDPDHGRAGRIPGAAVHVANAFVTTETGSDSYSNPPGTYKVRYKAVTGTALATLLAQSRNLGKTACWNFQFVSADGAVTQPEIAYSR